jgi:hypothetical protein
MNNVINVRRAGTPILKTYPYHLLNDFQDVSYAVGDSKNIWDTVFQAEIDSWPTDRELVYPTLVDYFTLKDNNYFGNKNRFTDELGGQDYVNNLRICHFTGCMIDMDTSPFLDWTNALDYCNSLTKGGYEDWALWSVAFQHLILRRSDNRDWLQLLGIFWQTENYYTSTTGTTSTAARVITFQNSASYGNINIIQKLNNTRPFIPYRKAFTYNPVTQLMELT